MRRVLVLAVLLAAALAAAPAATAWTWPVSGQVLRPFSLGPDPYAGGQHRGVDIGAELGASVAAPAAGTVSFAGAVPNGGRAVTIQTDTGYAVTLLQLASAEVARGDVVAEGDVVGVVGASDDAVTPSPHVHLGVRVASEPEGYVDPLGLLPPRPPEPAAATSPPPVPVLEPAPAAVPAPGPAAQSPAVEVEPTATQQPVHVGPPPAVAGEPAAPTPPVPVTVVAPSVPTRRGDRTRPVVTAPVRVRPCSRDAPCERRDAASSSGSAGPGACSAPCSTDACEADAGCGSTLCGRSRRHGRSCARSRGRLRRRLRRARRSGAPARTPPQYSRACRETPRGPWTERRRQRRRRWPSRAPVSRPSSRSPSRPLHSPRW